MVFTRVSTHFSVIHDGIFRVLKISARLRLPLLSRQGDQDLSEIFQAEDKNSSVTSTISSTERTTLAEIAVASPITAIFLYGKKLEILARSCQDNCDLDKIPGRTAIRLLCRDMNFSQELSYEVEWVQTSAKTFGESNHGLLFVFSCL